MVNEHEKSWEKNDRNVSSSRVNGEQKASWQTAENYEDWSKG